MAKIPTVIEFFYDIISPYSYLAFEVLCRYKSRWNINLQLKPFLLGGVMKATGNTIPATVPNKAAYMQQDLKRLQQYFHIPIIIPDNLMDILLNKGSLNVQRFITSVDILQSENTGNISRAMWKRLYETHEDITELESFRAAGKSIGMNESILEKAVSMINSATTKERLKLFTNQAVEYGAFGAPMIVAHVNGKPELFFGSDRFELLAHMIGEKWEGPVPGTPMNSKL